MTVTTIEDLLLGAARPNSIAEVEALPADTLAICLRNLDDEAASSLARFPQLRAVLHGGTSRITDAGVEHLSRIPSLEAIDLEWSASISDDALAALTRLSKLRWVDLSFCDRLTSRAVDEFRRSMPGCEVER
jgi:hypothetical protein